MKIQTLIGAGALGLASVAAAYAHGGATGIVKERMEAMESMGDVVKKLSAVMRGETEYDAAAVKAGAETIRKHAGKAITELFPEGSAGGPSEAKPDIWSNWDEFSALAGQLETLAGGLEAAAGNGLMHGGRGPGAGNMMGQGNGMMGSGSGMMRGGMMGSGSPMAGGGLMGGAGIPDADALAAMPADGVFAMTVQTCSACHTKFRAEEN
ncbi:c-type cytochrome [Oricola nitratireducens]|uniref:c-type cytochrome n=1 Tax=Oricola nitratireducens TaxID=2775868 RepID=UPI0018668328|nr:cytochrome c [Oricola nitratireducens]